MNSVSSPRAVAGKSFLALGLAMAAGVLIGCSGGGATASKAAESAPAVQLAGAETASTGRFAGQSGHVTSGGVSIERSEGKWYVVLAEDFSFDGAPDPKVALGANGFRSDAILSPLRSNAGRQVYEIPAGFDVSAFNQVWIWCEQYSVPLGVADLARI